MTDGFVPIPNAYIDRYLADLSGAELKVLLAILRRTVGWRKESDKISVRQLEAMTGLARHSVLAGIRGLLERGLITQTQAATGSKAASYACVIPSSSGAKSAPVDELGDDERCKKCTSSGAKSAPLGGAKSAPVDDDRCKNCTTSGAKTAPTTYIYRQQTRECARIARTLALARKRERKDPRLSRPRARPIGRPRPSRANHPRVVTASAPGSAVPRLRPRVSGSADERRQVALGEGCRDAARTALRRGAFQSCARRSAQGKPDLHLAGCCDQPTGHTLDSAGIRACLR